MSVDFQKLQEEVSETRALVQTLLERLNQPTSDQQQSDFLTVNQAAEFLSLTPATVYSMVYEKRIPFSKPNGRLYFLRSDLTAWIKQGRQSSTHDLDEAARETIASRFNRRSQSKVRKGGRNAI
jgi:excisionase family DNA binding protein